jgi:putative ABC transport system permease protein
LLNLIDLSFGTMGFESFSEVVVRFRVTPLLLGKGLFFAIVIGILGSLLPAIRAARLPVIAALKSV